MPTGQPGSPAAETPSRAPLRLPPAVKIAAVVATALTAANCSAPRVASNGRTIDPKYGVVASPRVVEDGEPVPKGGGRELVGRPYQIAGKTYVPRENTSGYSRTGLASWYGAAFHGRLTANGEVFDRHSIAAAHTTMPLPSYARVTNLENRRSVIVRVNDRGPYHANRIMDVSEGVAEALEFKRMGTARVQVDYVGRASTRGSDDRKLLATLRTDGSPAPFPGGSRSMFAALEDQPAAAPARPQALRLPRRAALRRAGGAGSARPGRAGLQPPPEPDRSRRRRAGAREPRRLRRAAAAGAALRPRHDPERRRAGAGRGAGADPAVAPRFRRAVLRAAAAAAGAVREVGSVPGHEAAALRRP